MSRPEFRPYPEHITNPYIEHHSLYFYFGGHNVFGVNPDFSLQRRMHFPETWEGIYAFNMTYEDYPYTVIQFETHTVPDLREQQKLVYLAASDVAMALRSYGMNARPSAVLQIGESSSNTVTYENVSFEIGLIFSLHDEIMEVTASN